MGKSKFTEQQKDEIKKMYATGEYSIRALGRMYFVSHSVITCIVKPEYKNKIKEYHKQRWINNKERLSKQHKEYYENNKDFVKGIHKEYNKTHDREIKKWQRQYEQNHGGMYSFVENKNVEKIENYFLALKDDFREWTVHHRLETHNSDGVLREIEITPAELKALDMYYNRPADELIFLKRGQHRSIHNFVMNKHKR